MALASGRARQGQQRRLCKTRQVLSLGDGMLAWDRNWAWARRILFGPNGSRTVLRLYG